MTGNKTNTETEKVIKARPENEESRRGMVASCRFELQSQDPESRMIDHYTMRLLRPPNAH